MLVTDSSAEAVSRHPEAERTAGPARGADGGVTWAPGLTHARRKRIAVGIVQALAAGAVSALCIEAAYLVLNGWPASLGQVRDSPYSVFPAAAGLIRLAAAAEFRPYLPLLLVAPFVVLASLRWMDLFGVKSGTIAPFGQTGALIRTAAASIAVLSILGLTYTGDAAGKPSSYMLLYFGFAGLILAFGLILTYGAIGILLLSLRSLNIGVTRVAVIARGEEAMRLAALFHRPNSDYAFAGFIAPDGTGGADVGAACPCIGELAQLDGLINGHGLDEIILAIDPGSLAPTERLDIAQICWRLGVELKMVTPFHPYFHTKGQPELFGDTPLLTIERVGLYVGRAQLVKRLFDIAVSAALLTLLSPFLLLLALLIRLDSPGPALFSQDRPGLHGRVFRILKFRSMRADTDHTLHQEAQRKLITEGVAAEYDEHGQPIYGKVKADPRVTRIGRFIRRTSIDELPQLINVLRGEMSLVGPRPSVLYELENYSEHHLRRLNIRPGITGLWQVSGRSRLSFEQMVELDITYIEEWSLWLDFKILIRTIPVVLRIDQAY